MPVNKKAISLHINKFITQHDLLYLGIVFNCNMNWNSHFKRVKSICSSRLFALRILKPLLSKRNLKIVYISLIRCVLEYGTPTTCILNSYCTNIIKHIIRRAHNIICFKNCNCTTLADFFAQRKSICFKTIHRIVDLNNHPLNYLFCHDYLPSGRLRIQYSRFTRNCHSFVTSAPQLYNSRFCR